jgi:hypothetical protein
VEVLPDLGKSLFAELERDWYLRSWLCFAAYATYFARSDDAGHGS